MEAFKITHACAHPNPLESAGGGTKRKLLCLMHSEAKQTETEFRQRKVYCRAMQGELGARAQKAPNSSKGFGKALLKAR